MGSHDGRVREYAREVARSLPLALAVVALGAGCDKKEPLVEAAVVERERAQAVADPFDEPVTAVEVNAESATIWARVAGAVDLELEIGIGDGESLRRLARIDPGADHTARLKVDSLVAGATYRYRWRARDAADAAVAAGEGRFVVPPRADDRRAVTFAFSGDLGGQNVCRDRRRGYPILARLEAIDLGFFIGLGDMIYADNPCLALGALGNEQIPGRLEPARTLDELRRAWRYNRADPGLAGLLSRTAYLAVWDDHEIENNFGPDERGGLFEVGLRAFREHNPVPAGRLYRSLRWGAYLELFVLDLRSHRSPNTAPDDAAKTMLGAEQKAWLLAALPASTARHKVVVSSVPIAVPTGDPTIGIDSWVGFETELAEIFARLAASGVERLVFLTTDVHFAAAHRFPPVAGARPEIIEIIAGPMSAGLFPTAALDPSFSPERLFFHGPDRPEALDFEAALEFMTAGIAEVDDSGMAVRIENATGKVLWQTKISSGGNSTSR